MEFRQTAKLCISVISGIGHTLSSGFHRCPGTYNENPAPLELYAGHTKMSKLWPSRLAEETRRWLLGFLGQLFAKWAWPQFGDLGRKLGAVLCELWTFGRGQVEHLHALAAQTDLIQQTGDLLDSAFCVDITFQVMAVAVQSAGHHHAVGAVLERIEHQEHVNLARAG
jgi:hypothetical protein